MPSPSNVIRGIGRPNFRTKSFVVADSNVSLATWSVTDKNANFAITGNGLIATASGAATDYAGRGTTATTAIAAAVKRYWEVTITADVSSGAGIANGTASFGDGTYLGNEVHSMCYYNAGQIYNAGIQIATLAAWSAGAILCFACDGANKLWARVDNGNWNNDVIANQNPATGTGGLDISTMGTVYPAYNGKAGAILTAKFGASFTYVAPSGFTAFP